MAGCGLITYYLHEPFEEFEYNKTTVQWKEFFRGKDKEWWIDNIEIVDNSSILFYVEKADIQNGGRYKLDINSLELIKNR